MEVQTLLSRNDNGAITAFNTGSLRAMTQPALLTNRNQFDSLSLGEFKQTTSKFHEILGFESLVCSHQIILFDRFWLIVWQVLLPKFYASKLLKFGKCLSSFKPQ